MTVISGSGFKWSKSLMTVNKTLYQENKRSSQRRVRRVVCETWETENQLLDHLLNPKVIQFPVFEEKMGKSGKSGKVNRVEPTDIGWIEKLPGCVELFQ